MPWIIEGNRLSWRSQWAITLNSAKVPAEIDLVRTSRQPAFRRRGLYKLEGDTLILSLSETERPKRLGGSNEDEGYIAVYKRKKP